MAHKQAIIIAAILSIAIVSAASGGTRTQRATAAHRRPASTTGRARQQDEMLNGLLTIAGLPLHLMDESAQRAHRQQVRAHARTRPRHRAHQLSEPLKADAAKMHDTPSYSKRARQRRRRQSHQEPPQTVHEDCTVHRQREVVAMTFRPMRAA
jgi:hypothetical protein